jgi:hypothetical protein
VITEDERREKYVALIRERFGEAPRRLDEGRPCRECGANGWGQILDHWPQLGR